MDQQEVATFIQGFIDRWQPFIQKLKQICYRVMAAIRIWARRVGFLPQIRRHTISHKRARIYQRRALIGGGH